MKQLASLTLLILFSCSFFSCSSAPKAITQPYSFQEKLEAAHHWEVIAQDLAKQLSLYLEKNPLNTIGTGYVISGVSVPNNPYIYIQTNDRSVFGKTFRQSLVTELAKRGYPIAYKPDAALTLRWSVKKIKYKAYREMNRVPGTFTALAALGYGVHKLYAASSAFGAAIGTGAAMDLLDQSNGFLRKEQAPNSEINLAVTISQKGIMLARQSEIYYINAEDLNQYSNIPDFEGQEEVRPDYKSYKVVNQ